MKNSIKFLGLVLLGLVASVSCQKNEMDRPNDGEGIFFSLRTGDASKTYIVAGEGESAGKYLPQWAKGDEIGVFFDEFASDKKTPAGTLENTNESGATAKFEGTIATAPGAGTLYAFYPASALGTTYDNKSIGFDMPSIQHPTATSFDPAADILVAKPVEFTATDGVVKVSDMEFARILATLKVNLKSDFADVKNQKVSSFKLEATEATLSGRAAVSMTVADGKITVWNTKSKSISATYGEISTVAVAGDDNSVFVTINPETIKTGETIKFTIETEGYIITKEITLKSDIPFTPGNLTEINLNIAEINCEKKVAETKIWVENFDKVTIQSQATPSQTGAAGTGVTDELAYTYSTDNTNVRVNGNGHGNNNPFLWISGANQYLQISNIAVSGETDLKFSCQVRTTQNTADVTLKYKESTAEGWNTADGKISATTSSINTVQSLIFTISEDITSLDLQIVGSAGNLVVDDIVLEKFIDERTTLATPTDVTPAVDSKTSNKINVTWTAVENADSYEVTLATTGEEDVVETSTTNSISFTGLKYSTQYSVKVKAISSDVTSYKDSEYSEPVNVTTGEKPAVQIDWVKKAVADILPTDEVVLVGNNSNTLNSTATSSSPTLVAVTVSNGKLTSEVTDAMKWNLVRNTTDGFILYANGTTDRYLYCNTTAKSSSNSCIRVGSQSSNIRNLWTINSDGYMITKDTYTTRYLSVYTDGPDWRGYTNTGTNPQKVEFYVKDDPRTALATPEINVTPDNTNKKITVNWTIVPNAADYTVTCTGQEDKTVTLASCEFTGLAYGDYTVTVQANPAEGSTTYRASEKAIKNVSVVDVTPVITAENPAAVEADATSVEVSYTVTNKVEGTNLTAAVTSGAWISNPQVAADKVTFTLSANTTNDQRTGTVTLSYAGAEDKVITITQKGAGQTGYASLEDLVAAGTPTGANVTVTFSNKEIIDFYKSNQYTNGIWLPVVGAPDNKIEIYCKNVPATWEVGGLVSGTLTDCEWKKYNDIWELCPSNWDDISYTAPLPKCEKPVITLNGAEATITCGTSGATIVYAISNDSTQPATIATPYSGAVTLTDGQTIWAKATKSGNRDSDVASKTYNTTPAKTYTATITVGSFNSGNKWTSYANVDGVVKGTDNQNYNLKGVSICWNQSYIQSRSSKNSVIYNTTSFGKITSIAISDDTAAAFTVTVGTSSNDGCKTATTADGKRTFNVTGDYGYFKIINSNTTIAQTTKIVITYAE